MGDILQLGVSRRSQSFCYWRDGKMAKILLWLLVRSLTLPTGWNELTSSEIIFNPLRYWFTRGGPFTKLFRSFLWSPIPPHAKWGIMAYIFSYYAIALSWVTSLINFALVGALSTPVVLCDCSTRWWLGLQDTFYVTSWQVFFICLLLFSGLNNLSLCILRYRLKLEDAGKTAIQQFKWVRKSTLSLLSPLKRKRLWPIAFFGIFFSGISFKLGCSLLAHLFSINVSWTSTSKEVTKSNFFLQVPMILKQFWGQILLSIAVIVSPLLMMWKSFIDD